MQVWTYWAGPMPRWIETCLDSMRRHCKCSTLNILTPETASLVTPHLHSRWRDLPPGVGTDCLRAALLYQHGGLWLDADTILVRDPIHLIEERHSPTQFLYSRWPAKPDRVIAGYVYAPEGHPIAKRWLDHVNGALVSAENVGWGDLGEKVLTLLVNSCPSSAATWQIPLETFLPVDVDTSVERYFRLSGWRDFATWDTIGFGLNFSWMMHNRREEMERDPDSGDKMIHRLLRDNR